MHKVALFFLGILGYSVVYFILYLIIFGFTIDIFPCGNQYLNDRLQINLLFYTLLILGFSQGIVCWQQIKKEDTKLFGYIGILFVVVSLFFAFKIASFGISKSDFYTDFNKEDWQIRTNRTIEMVRTIINEKLLLDMNQEELIKTLGEPDHIGEENVFIYNTKYEPIEVLFINNKVNEVNIQCWD